MQVVALWISSKPNKEFDTPKSDSQEVFFWYERTIMSLQFFKDLRMFVDGSFLTMKAAETLCIVCLPPEKHIS